MSAAASLPDRRGTPCGSALGAACTPEAGHPQRTTNALAVSRGDTVLLELLLGQEPVETEEEVINRENFDVAESGLTRIVP